MCMNAALSPLRLSGMLVLNYLDDWLIIAQSKSVLEAHKLRLLTHLADLGLSVNMQKSMLQPCQAITFLGMVLDSRTMMENGWVIYMPYQSILLVCSLAQTIVWSDSHLDSATHLKCSQIRSGPRLSLFKRSVLSSQTQIYCHRSTLCAPCVLMWTELASFELRNSF